jgi:hypothetical protein
MERASGWYKRKVQAMLLVLAAVVVIGLNVDTVHVGTALWNDAALRTAVAAQASAPQFRGSPSDAASAIDHVAQLKVPMGWGAGTQHAIFAAIPGWIVTIAALSLGAPFWFDVLSRVARMRGSGVPERPRSLSDTPGAERARADPSDDGAPPGAVPPAGQVAT